MLAVRPTDLPTLWSQFKLGHPLPPFLSKGHARTFQKGKSDSNNDSNVLWVFFLSFNRKPRENTVFLVFPSVSDWAQADHCRSERAEHKTFHFSDNFLFMNNELLYELRGRLLTHFHQGGRNKNGQRSNAVQLIQMVLVYLSHAFRAWKPFSKSR